MADTQDERTASAGRNRQERAARVAAMQRSEQNRARRRRVLIIAVPTVVVLGVAAGVTAVLANQPGPPSLAAVKTFTYTAGAHTTEPQTYAENPPVGGPHNPVWLNCGVYDAKVANENAVHSMEHGAVWITYAPDLAADAVATLKQDVSGKSYTILSPYDGLPSPIVLSAWNNQLQVTDAEDPRINAFLAKFVQGAQTPEPGALCSNGTGTPTG